MEKTVLVCCLMTPVTIQKTSLDLKIQKKCATAEEPVTVALASAKKAGVDLIVKNVPLIVQNVALTVTVFI